MVPRGSCAHPPGEAAIHPGHEETSARITFLSLMPLSYHEIRQIKRVGRENCSWEEKQVGLSSHCQKFPRGCHVFLSQVYLENQKVSEETSGGAFWCTRLRCQAISFLRTRASEDRKRRLSPAEREQAPTSPPPTFLFDSDPPQIQWAPPTPSSS